MGTDQEVSRATDFSRITNEHIHTRLETVAAIFMLACALVPLAAFLNHRYRRGRK